MKITQFTFPLLILLALFFTSCNGSVKGKWSEIDKKQFRRDMESVSELSVYGKNKSKMIECFLSKCEANYASYYEADHDEKGTEKFAVECSDEALSNGSVKGNWSEIDKNQFRKDLQSVNELNAFGEMKSEWIECYLSKLEANYSSYYKTNEDEKGVGIIAQSCTDELMK